MNKFRFWLKTSRPGLWFATIWLYMLPCSQMNELWHTWEFWLGLIYITFPLNFLTYGWNDIVDHEADQLNPRKNTFLFGAKGTKAQLKELWKPIITVQFIFLPLLFYVIGLNFIWLIAGIIGINWLYNLPQQGLRNRPPLELLCQIGYLLVVPLSIYLNDTPHLSYMSYIYLILFAWQSHLMGEVMDIKPDIKGGKCTTATKLGALKTKWIIILLVMIEIVIIVFHFGDIIFGGMLTFGLIWLLLDILVIYKERTYSLAEMKLFGYSSNAIAITSMAYVWYSGCLT